MNKKVFLRFWSLFQGYWKSEEKRRALTLLAVVISMNFAMVYILVLINSWYNEFYNSLQEYDYSQFWPLIGKFSLLAFIYIGIAVYAVYLRQLLQIRWREWMTNDYLKRWLSGEAYYRLQVMDSDMDNPDQRIQEDVGQFVLLSLTLLLGLLKHLTTLGAFAVVLWNLSGVLDVPVFGTELHIPGYMLWFSAIYSAVGSFLVHKVGKKLIWLNYDQQKYEADFRFSMTRLRENSESVAFYRGEAAENEGFVDRFRRVVKNFRLLMTQTKYLNIYSNGYSQLAVLVPIVLAAPRYFGGGMALGGLMQTVSAFGRVQDGMSYFIEAYDTIAQLVAVVERLGGFTRHLDEVSALSPAISREEGETSSLILQDVSVSLPDGKTLLSPTSIAIPSGRRLLVTGPSGCGKSTFLRMLSGIWPFGEGKMIAPKGSRILFLPQRPYLPLGTLRRALLYPKDSSANVSDERIREVLSLVDLAQFSEKLDLVDDWSRILSLGEQQRIAFARVFLMEPDWIFLDEATSALDEARESRLYALLRQCLSAAGVVSVGHRSSLFAQHDKELALIDGRAALRKIGDPFYSEANRRYLSEVIGDIDSGRSVLREHELFEE